jgi:hypothetical protein
MTPLLAALLVATPADDAFERRGRNVFVLEGIAGFANFRRAYPESPDEPESIDQFGALGMVPFTRVGYHRFVANRLSLGVGAQALATDGSLWFGRSTTLFNLSPRVGYSLSFSRVTSLWLRVGPGLQYATTKVTREGQLSVGGEATLVVIPAHDFGMTLEAFYDTGFAGREVVDADGTSRALRYRKMGLALGAVIAF